MAVQFSWEVGSHSAPEPGLAEALAGQDDGVLSTAWSTPPASAAPSATSASAGSGRRRPIWFPVYVLALVGAGWVGFHLGRWQEIRTSNVADIRNQLAVESLAWRENDRNLFVSTLDPGTNRMWQRERAVQFDRNAGRSYEAQATDIQLYDGGLALVSTEIEMNGTHWPEDRWYRLIKGSWYHTSGPMR